MKKLRTKADFVRELIAQKTEDLWLMEVVRDINKEKEPTTVVDSKGNTAAMQVDASEHRIKDIEVEITWLQSLLKSLE